MLVHNFTVDQSEEAALIFTKAVKRGVPRLQT